MLDLFRSAIAYRRNALILAHLMVFSACLLLAIGLPDTGEVPRLAGLVVFAIGMVLLLWNWTREQQERRLLSWMPLPVGLRSIQGARLLVPLALQLSLLPTAAVAILLRAPWHSLPPAGDVVQQLLGGQALPLILVYGIYLSDELSLVVRRSRLGLFVVNVVVTGLVILAFAWGDGPIDRSGSPEGLAAAYGLILALALICLELFVRRETYLYGISPIHGFPEKWSSDDRRRSK